MAEYIDRKTAIVKAVKCLDNFDPLAHDIKEAIKAIPTADVVERKHGKWKYQTMVHESGMEASGVKCSVCGATYNLSITLPDMMVEALNFCPNCGADMRGDEK